jgi:hypothetical protein
MIKTDNIIVHFGLGSDRKHPLTMACNGFGLLLEHSLVMMTL